MKKHWRLGAALLGVALLPAAVFVFHLSIVTAFMIAMALGPAVCGVTVTYASFQTGTNYGDGYAGGTTAPTAIQSRSQPSVAAQVNMADNDTSAVVTHNWGLTAAQLALLEPYVTITMEVFTTQNVPVAWIYQVTFNANNIVITKQNATSSGGTARAVIRRPWTASQ